MESIPVYIGISHKFDKIKGLTESSILSNTRSDVDIEYLYPEEESGCTGFSNVRYQVRYGIYLDCDMIVIGDIKELWSYKRSGMYVCMQDGRSEVGVIDCNHLCKSRHGENRLPKSCTIPSEWNCHDKYKEQFKNLEEAKLIHFTDLDRQPWFHDHPDKRAVKIYEKYRSIAGLD